MYDTPLRGHARAGWGLVHAPFAALLFVPLTAMHNAYVRLTPALLAATAMALRWQVVEGDLRRWRSVG
ncbi:hypothetical protein [Nocardia niigatensis]|uniref:hypothetical protein n=1 Tax=Nocardia niigatensis TaxID=209249 RepID=UPI0002FBEFC9|nr:hypothetical protein [Nocardia niigatensis]